jgi:hypothetical protein
VHEPKTHPVPITSSDEDAVHARESCPAGRARRIVAVLAIDVHPEALHRLSIDEYHELIRAGGFDEDARIELLDGLLVDMDPKTPRHEHVVARLADWLRDHVDRSAHQVRVCAPLTIGGSEPAA